MVNVSSGAATKAYPGWGAYCLGKAGLRMASMVGAIEAEEISGLAERDIAVVSFAPGVIETPMQDEVRASDPDHFPRRQRFVELKESGSLLDASLPAAAIADLLDSDDLPRYTETRYGG